MGGKTKNLYSEAGWQPSSLRVAFGAQREELDKLLNA
jgi:hypothetical protein